MLQKDYVFDKAFKIFDEINDLRIRLYEYKPENSDKIDTKSEMLEYLKIIEDKLICMLSTPSIIKEINNAKYKVYIKKN